MPADRRTMPTSTKPAKTERTHEENQERAYIAASRRSDRSLEARIESARRASEIHKKRTGRGLRVTEQDVVNEEMYEEEDEDLPTQYQRLSAHLHTGSLMFNRKLHDYIATQHGVRNAFLQQYSNAPFSAYAPQVTPNTGQFSPMHSPQVPQSQHMFPMLPPQVFNNTAHTFDQSTQPSSPTVYQQPQQNYRQSPYTIPQRPQPHQRSASISTPHQMTSFNSSEQYFAPVVTPRDEQRRLSLPPQAIEQSPRPSSPRGTPSQGVLKHPASPQEGFARASNSPLPADGTHSPQHENKSMASYPFITMNYSSAQVLNLNPLSLSLPPESQQFLGSTLDPNDPLTSIFMSGSEYITQPFGKYTYNPNVGSKAPRMEQTSTSSSTIPSGTIAPATNPLQLETALDNTLMSTYPTSAKSDEMMSSAMFAPSSYEFPGVFDGEKGITEEFDDSAFENAFINADAWDN